jgi:uncharacterized protein
MLTPDTARSWYPAFDPIHGFDHVLRVYRLAERLALAEGADLEIVRAAALLHDAQDSSAINGNRPAHQHASADFAQRVLEEEGWPAQRIAAALHCIRAHRFRDGTEQPRTLEAQVLFDADKLDAIGATGVARALAYAVLAGAPAYWQPSELFLRTGQTEPGEPHSSYHEYLFKLRHLMERMHTPTARSIAEERHRLMTEFYINLADEWDSLNIPLLSF